jgi:phospholipid/cholesterol/gamma-HCH transport system ATP-binding protein
LRSVSFDIRRGESYVIIGASGSGKSILVKCILKLVEFDSGTIKINGEDINKMSAKEIQKTRLKCGILYQGGALFDSLNVIDNISFGLIYGYGMPVKKAHKIAIEKLEAVDLSEKIAHNFPSELSGGMKKRVALARTIATNPNIIFLDEPTTGLDPITSGIINKLIVKCAKEMNISVVSITHDVNSLKYISDRVSLLHGGEIIWEGTDIELTTTDNPYVQQFITGSPDGPFTSLGD